MGCCHYYQFEPGFENVFSADVSRLRYGDGVIKELGQEAASLGMRRTAIFTDAQVRHLPLFDEAVHALSEQGIDVTIYESVRVEPTDLRSEPRPILPFGKRWMASYRLAVDR